MVDTVIAAPTATTSLPDHKIVPNDLLSISVFDEPEVSRPAVRVGAEGTIVMPLLKDPVQVEGLLPGQLADEISRPNSLRSRFSFIHWFPFPSWNMQRNRSVSVGDVRKSRANLILLSPITLL